MATPVALAQCRTYDEAQVRAAMEKLLGALGGMGRFVQSGQTVLLKPNLLSDHLPSAAVTTHPAVVRELIGLVRQAGGQPVVADSAASAIKIERVWATTGFGAMCAAERVPLLNLEKAGARRFEFQGQSLAIAKPILEADVLINVPKLKTHMLTVLTNAVKNLYGTLPGYQKTMLHKHFPDAISFSRLLAELYAIVRPALTVSDAIVAMEGHGPSAGEPLACGLLAASADGVALDTALCQLLGINPQRVPYLRFLQEAGTGQTDWQALELSGDPPAQLELRPLRLPRALSGKPIPDWLHRWAWRYLWTRPVITDRCRACGLCVQACPVEALSMAQGARPELNYSRCIQCCCCHEVCPAQAINMQQSPLLATRERVLSGIMRAYGWGKRQLGRPR